MRVTFWVPYPGSKLFGISLGVVRHEGDYDPGHTTDRTVCSARVGCTQHASASEESFARGALVLWLPITTAMMDGGTFSPIVGQVPSMIAKLRI